MDLNWKGMKSIMGFYPKSESRAMCLLTWVMSHLNNRCVRKFQSQNLLVLTDHSVQVGTKNLNGLNMLLKEMQRSAFLVKSFWIVMRRKETCHSV
ncbi:hypothetical protein T4D_990 [Trichinella pseudospiralis]|uniref:Uncharacterized protein n=1 Tax=Trichinella pseudospiralis TaxID=6337 RepID=A0A0V1G4H9_TRIPS|nr:hypothetical protein T4D_990 [Trichinella pseudospiralis]